MAGSKRIKARHDRLYKQSVRSNPQVRRMNSVEKVAQNTLKRVVEYPEPLPAGEPGGSVIGNPMSKTGSLGAYLEGIRPEYERKIAELRSRTDVPDHESA